MTRKFPTPGLEPNSFWKVSKFALFPESDALVGATLTTPLPSERRPPRCNDVDGVSEPLSVPHTEIVYPAYQVVPIVGGTLDAELDDV